MLERILKSAAPITRLALALLYVLALGTATATDAAPVSAKAPEAAPAGAPTATKSGKRAAYLHIDDAIDPIQERYLARTLTMATEQNVDVVVIHMTSDGGRLDSASLMVNRLLAVKPDRPRLVAWIDNKAWSAGAMISYACDEVWMGPNANIGDIGVIFLTQEGKIEYAPEKIESPVRAMLRRLAQIRNWNEPKLVKMTARNQELYRIDVPAVNGKPERTEYVIEDNWPVWKADWEKANPVIPAPEKILVAGKDRLLSYTAKEAVTEGMATGTVADLDALYAKLGIDKASLVDLQPTTNDRVSRTLAGWAPILAALAVLFLILEFKIPGGLFITLAAVAGAAFIFCQYYQDFVSALEIIAILAGVALIIVDLFVLPTGGLLAGLGAMLMVGGLIASFMPNVDKWQFSSPGWGNLLGRALLQSTVALVLIAFGLVAFISALPRMRAARRMAVQTEIGGTSGGTIEAATTSLVGRLATARSDLMPGGFVVVNDGPQAGKELSATAANGEAVKAGATVEIVAISMGEVVVRPQVRA